MATNAETTAETHARRLCLCVVAVAVVLASGLALSSRSVALPVLVGIAMVLGLELRVGQSSAVPPLAAALAVIAVVIVGTNGSVMGALVGATTAATAWALARDARPAVAAWSIACSTLAGVAGGSFTSAISTGSHDSSVLFIAMGAGAMYCTVAVLACRGRARTAASAAWSAPVIVVAALLASSSRQLGAGAVVVSASGVAGALFLVAWAAAPPWNSRFLGRYAAGAPGQRRIAVLLLATAATAGAVGASLAAPHGAAVVLAFLAAALAETLVAMTLAMVRQWRFAPRARIRDASLLLAVAVAIAAGYVRLALDGRAAAPAVLGALLVAAVVLGWRVVDLSDRAVDRAG